jgi:hypothetical protein
MNYEQSLNAASADAVEKPVMAFQFTSNQVRCAWSSRGVRAVDALDARWSSC